MATNRLLIDKRDMKRYVQVTNKNNEEIINQYIRDAQDIDLANLICEQYLSDMRANPSEYKELLKGGTYQYDGITYTNAGLEIVLSNFAYARYLLNGSYNDTAFGLVEKNNPDSNQVSENTRQRLYTFNRQKAMTYWENVKRYLQRTNYKKFNDICKCKQNGKVNSWQLNVISNDGNI